MKLSDLIVMCLQNLTRRRFRTFLTVMGVVIGTCAIVVMISLGVGISISNQKMLESFGDLTVIEVDNYSMGSDLVLDDATIAQIQAMDGVQVATPFHYFEDVYPSIYAGKKNRYSLMWSNIVGVYPEALEAFGYEIAEGTMYTGLTGKKIEVLFGQYTAYNFEDTRKKWPNSYIDVWMYMYGELDESDMPDPFFDPLETTLTLELPPANYDWDSGKTTEFELVVSGILVGDRGKGYETIQGIFIPMDDMNHMMNQYYKTNNIKPDKTRQQGYRNARVKAIDLDHVAEVEQAISDMGFGTYSMERERQSMQESAQQIQLILGILGGVSLFVAAISITNTMIMSVYERTREIGVMKVLGCLVGNIRSVFLLEAGLIGLIGGIVGIGFSYLLSFLLNRFGGMLGSLLNYMPMDGESAISVIPAWLALLGLVFATLIGLIAGFQPANRAVRISALEAIKTE